MNDDRTQTMVQPPPLTLITTEATVWHSEPASWMTTEPRPWCYLCYLPSLSLHSQPTKEPGQVIVASLQQNLLRHVAELGHLSSLTGQQIWRVHGITRWWEVRAVGLKYQAFKGKPTSQSREIRGRCRLPCHPHQQVPEAFPPHQEGRIVRREAMQIDCMTPPQHFPSNFQSLLVYGQGVLMILSPEMKNEWLLELHGPLQLLLEVCLLLRHVRDGAI